MSPPRSPNHAGPSDSPRSRESASGWHPAREWLEDEDDYEDMDYDPEEDEIDEFEDDGLGVLEDDGGFFGNPACACCSGI